MHFFSPEKTSNLYLLQKLRHFYKKIVNFSRKTEQFCEKNSEISQKTESTGGLDPKILQNFGEKKASISLGTINVTIIF